jgi:hypothetical protein
VNIQEYISSGIIESCVMGMATTKEQADFEKLCSQYPELQKARFEFELKLEKKTFENAVEPPAFLKRKILDQIQEEKPSGQAMIIPLESSLPPVRSFAGMRWAIVASVILSLGCGYCIYIFYSKNQELKSAVSQSKDAIDKLGEKERLIEEKMLPENSHIKMAKLVSPEKNITTAINVYWDSTSANVYLVIKNLAQLSPGQHYQLWAVTNGKYKSLGLFDAPEDDKLILKMNNVQKADSFTITIIKANDNVMEPVFDTVSTK